MAGEALLLPSELHVSPQPVQSFRSVLASLGRNVQRVGSLHKARNGSTIPGLDGTNQRRQTIHVTVVNINVAAGADQVELVEQCTHVSSKLVVAKQPTNLTSCSISIGNNCAVQRLPSRNQPEATIW
jgi:hypothetical protein